MQPESRAPNLVVLIIIGLATFLLPIVQRWLKRRAERAGAAPRDGDDASDVFDPFRGLRREEPESPETLLDEEEAEEPAPAEAPPVPVDRAQSKPLLQPSTPVPSGAKSVLETRLFTNRRWRAGAKLVIAKEILESPRCFRRSYGTSR